MDTKEATMFEINNRRYTGSKFKLKKWIEEEIIKNCPNSKSFCDLFSGTGIIASTMLKHYDKVYVNDFLVSNEIIYKAFFLPMNYDYNKINDFKARFNQLNSTKLKGNYVSKNFGDKYFDLRDSLLIGEIRELIENNKHNLNEKEYAILLTSLIYSFDRISRTVGHYEAFIKTDSKKSNFKFDLIEPIVKSKDTNKKIFISQEDANALVRKIRADVFYIDPPYSSRQYSRFYHVIETIVKWEKPKLFGVAMKPEATEMSEYSKSKAKIAFKDLIENIDSKFLVVSYNNTYSSKSRSSENKMTLIEITDILKTKGKMSVLSKKHMAFNAGKTNFLDHKEYLFIVEVGKFNE
jgi:adenine-specific DNA-methyltransferase